MSLTQEEIDALMSGGAAGSPEETAPAADAPDIGALSEDDIDILGEVGNICMGAVATTMYTLLDRPVNITTPRVSVHTASEVLAQYVIPFVTARVEFTEGVEGKNLLVLRQEDAALITDLLMGGDGNIEQPVVLDDLHLSAISEIMNQMMGASATSLSRLLDTPVNISPPITKNFDSQNDDVSTLLDASVTVIKISFRMEIEGLLDSELLQLIPLGLGLELATRLKENGMGASSRESEIPDSFMTSQTRLSEKRMENEFAERSAASARSAPSSERPSPAPAPTPAPVHVPPAYAATVPPAPSPGTLVDVHPVQYQSFDQAPEPATDVRGMDMIYDIPLSVTVELGKTKRQINEILKFGVGTLIVIEKTAGDPVEVIVNGKLIARGEVVVIDENYGVRITELLNG